MLRKFYKKINKNMGVKIFGNPNSVNYNLFNILYDKFILRKETEKEYLKNFYKDGYFKTEIVSKDLVDLINDQIITPQQDTIDPKTKKHIFFIPKHLRKNIIDHIYKDYGSMLKEMQKFYNNRISISEIVIRRNYPLDNTEYYKSKIRTKDMEVYNNYYHVDFYVSTFFKMFINLSNVTEENGPLHIYDIRSTGEYIDKFNYSSRLNYEPNEIKNRLKINSGFKGESLVADTTKCLHRAGLVQNGYRDMLFVIFGLIPEKFLSKDTYENLNYFNNIDNEALWNKSAKFTKIYKPQSLKKTLKLYWDMKKSKLT